MHRDSVVHGTGHMSQSTELLESSLGQLNPCMWRQREAVKHGFVGGRHGMGFEDPMPEPFFIRMSFGTLQSYSV